MLLPDEVDIIELDWLIICPECGAGQSAKSTLRPGDPYWSYVHICTECGCIIMESEWNVAGDDWHLKQMDEDLAADEVPHAP